MEAKLEQEILERLKRQNLSDVPGCPVASFSDLSRGVDAGEFFVGVDYMAANKLAHSIFGLYGSLIAGLISWVPYLVATACLPTGYFLDDFWVLAGVPLALIAMFFASPVNPARRLATLTGVLAAGGVAWFWSQSVATLTVLCLSYAVSFYAIRFLYFHNSRKLTRAALDSEPLFLYLLETGHVFIRDIRTGEEFWGEPE